MAASKDFRARERFAHVFGFWPQREGEGQGVEIENVYVSQRLEDDAKPILDLYDKLHALERSASDALDAGDTESAERYGAEVGELFLQIRRMRRAWEKTREVAMERGYKVVANLRAYAKLAKSAKPTEGEKE